MNPLQTGLENDPVVFLAPILLSTHHASKTSNVSSLNSLKSLPGRVYREGTEAQEGCAKPPAGTGRAWRRRDGVRVHRLVLPVC